MKAVILCIALTSFLMFSSCSDDSPTNSSSKTYKYTGYDSTGNKIISGYLWIDSVDSTVVKGRWDFKQVSNEENLGPQTGKGNFEGIKDLQGNMSLNLNPGWIDNNVFLIGSFHNLHYNGDWNYVGFPGVINSGSFEAIQYH
jgi:hypothetical protein